MGVLSDKKVLLIEDTLPWGSNANSVVLDAIGLKYQKISSNVFFSMDLSDVCGVIVANDQTQTTYNNYSKFKTKLDNFISDGGILCFGACFEGSSGNGTIACELPNGVTVIKDYANNNYIVNKNNPIITGELSDGIPLTNNDLVGGYCSHVYFKQDSLPAGCNIILYGNSSNRPTLVEYGYGKGFVILSGLTWEHNYTSKGSFGLKALDDLYLYTARVIQQVNDEAEREKIVKPKLIRLDYPYSGNEIEPLFDAKEHIVFTGNTSEIDVKDYIITARLPNKVFYEWEDGTTDDLPFNWSIVPAVVNKPLPYLEKDKFDYNGTEQHIYGNAE